MVSPERVILFGVVPIAECLFSSFPMGCCFTVSVFCSSHSFLGDVLIKFGEFVFMQRGF